MKKLILSTALCLVSSMALATECKKQGGGYTCPTSGGDIYVDGSKAESAAAAAAYATAKAEQEQSQSQSQSSNNTNANVNQNVNGGNSVNIEGDPSHTTSVNLGASINFSVPIASGVQTRNAIDTANWFIQNGLPCPAYKVMEKAPRVRALKINISCGDKG